MCITVVSYRAVGAARAVVVVAVIVVLSDDHYCYGRAYRRRDEKYVVFKMESLKMFNKNVRVVTYH